MSVLLLMLFVLFMFFIMYSFSERQRSQVLFPGEYTLHSFKSDHFVGGTGFSLCCQMYCDSVVADFLVSALKLCVWLLYRVLNVFSVLPMYCIFLPSWFTSA